MLGENQNEMCEDGKPVEKILKFLNHRLTGKYSTL